LTKVIATTTAIAQLVESGRLSLESRIDTFLRAWRGSDRAQVTVRDLLAHCSGLTAHLPFYRDCERRAEFERAICELPLEYEPRSRAVYSDLGFILLGFIAEDVAGSPLDVQMNKISAALGDVELAYRPSPVWRARAAPTGLDAWRGRVLRGEVHDRNAWALGGVAGHAGVFGTATGVATFARDILAGMRGLERPSTLCSRTVRCFTERTNVPGSSRALGWDTMLPTSSCGTLMSPGAIGHTGYTGTSLWIDPEHDIYVVLLTNRVHPTDANDGILSFRSAFHDQAMRAQADA
jgi:CubicO group peptidase (beta-lactamase class C family)